MSTGQRASGPRSTDCEDMRAQKASDGCLKRTICTSANFSAHIHHALSDTALYGRLRALQSRPHYHHHHRPSMSTPLSHSPHNYSSHRQCNVTTEKIADTPEGREYTFLFKELMKVKYNIRPLVTMEVRDGVSHPLITTASRMTLLNDYFVKLTELGQLDMDVLPDMSLSERFIKKWLSLPPEVLRLTNYRTHQIAQLSDRAFIHKHMDQRLLAFHDNIQSMNDEFLKHVMTVWDLTEEVETQYENLTNQMEAVAKTMKAKQEWPVDIKTQFTILEKLHATSNGVHHAYATFTRIPVHRNKNSLISRLLSVSKDRLQIGDLLNVDNQQRAKQAIINNNNTRVYAVQKSRDRINALFVHKQSGTGKVAETKTTPLTIHPTAATSSSSSVVAAEASRTVDAVTANGFPVLYRHRIVDKKLTLLRDRLSDTASTRAYLMATEALAGVDITPDQWVTVKVENGEFVVGFTSSIIPEICTAYASCLEGAITRLGKKRTQTIMVLAAHAKMLGVIAHTAIHGDIRALMPDGMTEAKIDLSDWAKRTSAEALRLMPALGHLMSRMERLIVTLRTHRSSWPVDTELEYSLSLAIKDSLCATMLQHMKDLTKEYHGVSLMTGVGEDAEKTCRCFVNDFDAHICMLDTLARDLRKQAKVVMLNVERMKRESVPPRLQPLPALELKPVQYQATSSISSSSTSVPNSHRRKEKVKTRAAANLPSLAEYNDSSTDAEEEEEEEATAATTTRQTESIVQHGGAGVSQVNPQAVAVNEHEKKRRIERLKKRDDGCDMKTIRSIVHNQMIAEKFALEEQRKLIENNRERVESAQSENDLPAIASAPPGGHNNQFQSSSSSSTATATGTGDGEICVHPGGLTEKQIRKLEKKRTKAASMHIHAFHAQTPSGESKDEEKKKTNKKDTKKK